MSPRRRLRTRYEPDAKPARPSPPAAREETPAEDPDRSADAGTPRLLDPPAFEAEELDLAEAVGAPIAAPAPAPPVPAPAVPTPPVPAAATDESLPIAPATEPVAAPAEAPLDPLIAPPVAEPLATPVATPPDPLITPPLRETVPMTGAQAPALMPVRPSPEVIEEWALAFEQPVEPEAAEAARAADARRRHAWRRIRALLTLGALAILAFITGLFVFNSFVMPRLIHGVGQVTVPDLTNLTVEQAEQALRPLGLRASRAGERFDPAAPRGFIIDQEPIAGSTVRGRKRVSIVVSLGEEYSSVPELFGESVRAARLLLERAGLQPGTVVQAPSDEAGEGLVAGSDPGAEAVLQRNTPVHLLVSIGPGPESYVMPDLLGREISSVRRQLEAIGFRVERSGSRTPVGTIVAQTPAPGARITRANVIQLTSSGRVIR